MRDHCWIATMRPPLGSRVVLYPGVLIAATVCSIEVVIPLSIRCGGKGRRMAWELRTLDRQTACGVRASTL